MKIIIELCIIALISIIISCETEEDKYCNIISSDCPAHPGEIWQHCYQGDEDWHDLGSSYQGLKNTSDGDLINIWNGYCGKETQGCTENDTSCSGDSIYICISGSWQIYSCEELCLNGNGYTGDCSMDYEKNHDVCWCNTDPEEDSAITIRITDQCNDGLSINYRFFDKTNDLVWPSYDKMYYTESFNTTCSHNLSCTEGAKICYGGETGSIYWGAGINGDKGCDNCCVYCEAGGSIDWNLTCD